MHLVNKCHGYAHTHEGAIGKSPVNRATKGELGGMIDPSHHIAWYRGVTYCLLCGTYEINRKGGLHKQCRMKPPNATAKRRLMRIKDGRFPREGEEWPEPDCMQAPMLLKPLISS